MRAFLIAARVYYCQKMASFSQKRGFRNTLLESVVKLDSQTCDSLISVIPAKECHPVLRYGAGIQNSSMPQNDLYAETPGFRLSPE